MPTGFKRFRTHHAHRRPQDMALWVFISFVFIVAFAVTFFSIAETENMNEVLQVPVWSMYGDFDADQMFEWSDTMGRAAPPLDRRAPAPSPRTWRGRHSC